MRALAVGMVIGNIPQFCTSGGTSWQAACIPMFSPRIAHSRYHCPRANRDTIMHFDVLSAAPAKL
jgi:hypothetical protein